MLSYCLYRIGAGLRELYNFPEVQMFLNCLQSKEIYEKKCIYQPGCLRKVYIYAYKLTGTCVCIKTMIIIIVEAGKQRYFAKRCYLPYLLPAQPCVLVGKIRHR